MVAKLSNIPFKKKTSLMQFFGDYLKLKIRK